MSSGSRSSWRPSQSSSGQGGSSSTTPGGAAGSATSTTAPTTGILSLKIGKLTKWPQIRSKRTDNRIRDKKIKIYRDIWRYRDRREIARGVNWSAAWAWLKR